MQALLLTPFAAVHRPNRSSDDPAAASKHADVIVRYLLKVRHGAGSS